MSQLEPVQGSIVVGPEVVDDGDLVVPQDQPQRRLRVIVGAVGGSVACRRSATVRKSSRGELTRHHWTPRLTRMSGHELPITAVFVQQGGFTFARHNCAVRLPHLECGRQVMDRLRDEVTAEHQSRAARNHREPCASCIRTACVVVGCDGVDVLPVKGHADARAPDGAFLRSAGHRWVDIRVCVGVRARVGIKVRVGVEVGLALWTTFRELHRDPR